MRRAVPSDDPSGFPGAEDETPAVDGRKHGRVLEVVVPHVVTGDLVVPEELARAAREHEQRVGVKRTAREQGAIRIPLRAAPRPRVRVADIDVASLVDAHGVPGTTTARIGLRPWLGDRPEAPHDVPIPGVERVDGPAAAVREALRAVVDAAAIRDGRDPDELLEAVDKPPRPERLSCLGVEGESRRVGCRVEPRGGEGDAVRAGVRRREAVCPAQRSGLRLEREDRGARVLHVDGAASDHRVRRDRAKRVRAPRETEAPEGTHRTPIEHLLSARARAREIAVRDRPRPLRDMCHLSRSEGDGAADDCHAHHDDEGPTDHPSHTDGVLCIAARPALAAPSQAHATAVTVTASEFKLSKASVSAGSVAFSVTNKGKIPHDFEIAGKKTPLLKPGKSAKLTVTLKKGKNAYVCTVAGHAALGMKGSLTAK